MNIFVYAGGIAGTRRLLMRRGLTDGRITRSLSGGGAGGIGGKDMTGCAAISCNAL